MRAEWSILFFAVTACGGPPAGRPGAVAAPATPLAANRDTVLATVDGIAIRRLDVDKTAEQELKSIDNEAEQRKFHLLWSAVDQAVGQTLMIREAERRGITVEALRKLEITSKVPPPNDDEVRAIYDANKQYINAALDVAAPYIREQLADDRGGELERALIEQLRRNADVRFAIPPPELPRFDVEPGSGAAWGPANARVTLIAFSDFECPYCSRARHMIDKLKDLYPGRLRVVFRDFPLDQHPHAHAAAEAAACAAEQDKFWAYHDTLFDNSSALEAADLRRYAAQVKLDLGAYDQCITSPRPKKTVAANQEAGRRYGVDGTPAIFVNGMKMVGLLPLPLMQAIIDRELTRVQ